MSEFAELKETALLDAVVRGPQYLTHNRDIPERVARRWMRMFKSVHPHKLNILMNHFQLGGDPEFGLKDAEGHIRNAMDLGLHTGAAFGADLNGRLAELRCAPSRSALRVVAATLGTLRWFATIYPKGWCYIQATPLFGRDGLGGHVHFGRKRTQLRGLEVTALDRLTHILCEEAAIFPGVQVKQRRETTPYGRFGDTRPQLHGYEYRVLPTWLASPWHAMLCLTLSKLFVARPRLVEVLPTKGVNAQMLTRLLHMFQYQDEDIRICCQAIQVLGWPTIQVADTCIAWGLRGMAPNTKVDFVPSVIRASDMDIIDIERYLFEGKDIPARVSEPTWEPKCVPEGYMLLTRFTPTCTQKQVGEILHGLVTSETISHTVVPSNIRELVVEIPEKVSYTKARKLLPPEIQIIPRRGTQIRISLGLRSANEWTPVLRKFLTSGIFYIWYVDKLPEKIVSMDVPAKKHVRNFLYNSNMRGA